jgi:hypothetical protein
VCAVAQLALEIGAERCLGYGRKDTVVFSEVLRGLVGLAERRSIDDEPLGT